MASSAAAPREDRTSLGVAFMCAAVFCFTTIDSSAKWLILAGLPAIQVVFARYAGAFVVSLLLFLRRRDGKKCAPLLVRPRSWFCVTADNF